MFTMIAGGQRIRQQMEFQTGKFTGFVQLSENILKGWARMDKKIPNNTKIYRINNRTLSINSQASSSKYSPFSFVLTQDWKQNQR